MNKLVARLAACLLAGLAVVGAAAANPRVLVTIDVESLSDLPLPDQLDARCEGDEPCSLFDMAAALERRGFAGVFFLNVYEHAQWGEDVLRSVAVRLEERGHDVALHTHPHWQYDPNRPYMYSYTFEEQRRIVAEGVRLLEQWTGLPVVAHRAGAYSADRNTMRALASYGVVLDSSLFYGHPHSQLNGLGLPMNQPSTIEGVTEIPVTVYRRRELPAVLGSIAPAHRALNKVDVDSIATPREARAAIDALVAADVPYIVVFLHSFSLISKPGSADRAAQADARSISVFATLLDAIEAHDLTVTTSRELAARRDAIVMDEPDVTPELDVQIPAHKYAWRMLRAHATSVAAVAALLALATSAAFLRKRIVRRRAAARAASSG